MRTTQKRVRKKAAFAAALTMVVSLASIAPTNAASKANNLVIAISEKDSGWCLQDSPGNEQILAKNQVSETLMTTNDKGKTVPYLASKVENSADFKTWKFTLREGIFFHDGEELTAATVIANVAGNLGLNPLIPASLPAIAWQDGLGGVTSLAQFAAKVQAVGKYQVQFNLPAPRPLFNEIWGARSTLWSTKTLQTKQCGQTVGAGTGPFMIQSKGTDQFKTVLVANPNYWRKDSDGKPLPKAHVVLSPVDRAVDGPFVADTDSDGRFSLGAIGRPSSGVRPGTYRLSISTAFSMDSDAPPPKELVPARYVRGVDYEVGAGGDAGVTIALDSAAKQP